MAFIRPTIQQIIDQVFGLSNPPIAEEIKGAVESVRAEFIAPSGVVLESNYNFQDKKYFAQLVLEELNSTK